MTKIQFLGEVKTGCLQNLRNISKSIKAFEMLFYTNVENCCPSKLVYKTFLLSNNFRLIRNCIGLHFFLGHPVVSKLEKSLATL